MTLSLTMPPGPRPLPIIGRRGQKMLFYRDPIAYHRHVYATYGMLASFVYGGSKLVAYGPEYNRQIFNQPEVFHADRVAAPGPRDSSLHRLGTGLNTMSGELHRQHRRLMLPAFHRQQIETYRDTMAAITGQFLDRWPIGQVVDVAHLMQQLTLCIVNRTLFGVDAAHDAGALGHLIARWIGLNANRLVYLLPFDWPGTPFWRLMRLSERLEGHLGSIIRQRRATDTTDDLLSLLLQAHDEAGMRLTDTELIGHATVLFIAGFETSAVALTWTLFLLAQHPHVLADLLDELAGVLRGDAPSVAQVRELPLLDRVIKESLRLFPPAIHGGRIAAQPFSMGRYDFPAGTKVMYSEFITHRMPELYSQPERFDPQRWLGPEPSPFAYIPFLVGPRRCLGAEFAMLEMKIVLAMVLQRFRLELPPNTRIDRAVVFTLLPKHGLPMRVLPQDRLFRRTPVRGNIHELVDLAK